jgi:hypothetical protein
MAPFRPRRMALAAATSLAALGACGSDNAGPLDDRQVDELGAALRDEVETEVGGFSVRGVLLPFSERVTSGGAALAALQLCDAGVTPSANNDGDPVPDSIVFTFTVPPCTYEDVRDGRVEVSGAVEIVDPTPAVAGFEYRARLANLAYRYVTPDLAGNYTVLRNGTLYRGGDAAGLTVSGNLQIRRALADSDADVTQDWTTTFTPAAGNTAQLQQPLTDGTIAIEGTFTWSGPGESYSLTVSTPTPLEFDADCTGTPQRIVAGELRAAGTFEGQDGYVQLTWNDCGDEPDIRFVAAGE